MTQSLRGDDSDGKLFMTKGLFITFEGSEGSGKSTQAKFVYDYLRKKGKKVMFIREPGGVKISEAIRKILLDVKNTKMCDETEALLYMAARAQLVHDVIEPALKSGKIILCDRFLDSTVCYQGYGNGVDIDFIKTLGRFVTRGIQPHLTFIFDLDVQEGLRRRGSSRDRIERRAVAYHNRVRNGYLKLAKQEPRRIKVIKVNQSKEEIFKVVRKFIDWMI